MPLGNWGHQQYLAGDSGFCRHQMFDWCERNNVYYITGIAGNSCLEEILKPTINEAGRLFCRDSEKAAPFCRIYVQS